jgi:hypothetical protein
MTSKHDDLFMEDTDPFWTEPVVTELRGRKSKRDLLPGRFYLCPEAWADEAAKVCGPYLILALRLYRHWRMRERGTNSVAVTAAALGPGASREGRLRMIARLEMAGLLEIVEQAPGKTTRVRIIDPPRGYKPSRSVTVSKS